MKVRSAVCEKVRSNTARHTTQYDTAKHALYLAAAVATKQQQKGNNQTTNNTNEGKGKKETSK